MNNPLYIILVIVLVLLLLGGLPQIGGNWHNMGYGLSGGVGLVLVIVVLVLLLR